MSKHPQPNPRWEPEWDRSRNNAFLDWARKWFYTQTRVDLSLNRLGGVFVREPAKLTKDKAYELLYLSARTYRAYCGSYSELVEALGGNRRYFWRGNWWYEKHKVGFREGMAYRRLPHHAPKVPSGEPDYETAHRALIRRDKAKRGWRAKHGRWKRHMKEANNRGHRRWVSQMLCKESNWDEFHERSYRGYEDRWSWD